MLAAPHKSILYFSKDVDVNHWAYEAVQRLSLAGVFEENFGYKFEPGQHITRAEFVKIVIKVKKLLGQHRSFPTPSRTYAGFSDVHPGDKFFEYIKEAYELQIINGVNNTFQPNIPILLAEAAMVIIRAFHFTMNQYTNVPFVDVTFHEGEKPWYYDAVGTINELKIMTGDNIENASMNTFRPIDGLNRAEAAVILLRVIKMLRE